jgi:hypothetical protein
LNKENGPLRRAAFLVYVVGVAYKIALNDAAPQASLLKHGLWGTTGRNTARRSSSTCCPCRLYRQGFAYVLLVSKFSLPRSFDVKIQSFQAY